MSFVESFEFSLGSLLENKGRQVIDALGGEHKGKNLSNSGDNLGLLSLIVQNRNLLSFVIFELSSEQRVASDDCDNFGVEGEDDIIDS